MKQGFFQVKKKDPLQEGQKSGFTLRGLKAEFGKITWTSKAELLPMTYVVVSSIFVFGIVIYLADLLIRGMLNGLSALFNLITG